MISKIKTAFLANKDFLYIEGLKRILKGKNYHVSGTSDNERETISNLERLNPDILVTGIFSQNIENYAKRIKESSLNTRTLLLLSRQDFPMYPKALSLNLDGYLTTEDSDLDCFMSDLERFTKGEKVYCQKLGTDMVKDHLDRGVTQKELEVIRYVALGYSNKEIANYLNIGQRTVETHRERAMKKLNIHTVPGLVAHSLKRNYINVDNIELTQKELK